jgi:hypothetical protein
MCACPTYKVVDDHMRGSLIVLACKLVDHHSCSKIIGQLADSISVNYSIDSSFNHYHLAPPNPFASVVLVRDFDVVWYGGSSLHLHLDFSDLFSAGEMEWKHRFRNFGVVGVGP